MVHRLVPHQLKFSGGAGDSVSLSAMNERSSKHKPLLLPPSPVGTQASIHTHDGDEDLYANAFGPGHPQYLNELRRLKPEHTRMSARLPANRRVSIDLMLKLNIKPNLEDFD